MLNLYEELSTAIDDDEECKAKFQEEIEEDIENLHQLEGNLASILTDLYIIEDHDDPTVCKNAREVFPEVRGVYSVLAAKVTAENHFKYRYIWQDVTQNIIFHACLVEYLESGRLMSQEKILELFGFSKEFESGKFHLEMDDYLLSLLNLPEELVQLSMVYVIRGENKKSYDIMEFITDLNAGFKKLTLKNDILRRKYDGLKYHTKNAKDIAMDLDLFSKASIDTPAEHVNDITMDSGHSSETSINEV